MLLSPAVAKIRHISAIIMLITTTTSVMGSEQQAQVTGIYSNLQYIEEAGDLLGTELFIVSGPNGYEVVVQVAEGVPGPILTVPVVVTGTHVRFIVPRPSFGAGTYEGEIGPKGFEGVVTATFNGRVLTTPIRLARKNSYWQ